MKKTFVAGALAFTMAAAFLSGCGSNTQTKAANRLEEIQQRGYIEVATEPYFAPNVTGWKRFSREVTLKLLPNLISHQM